MSYSNSDVAHKWVHGHFNSDGEVNGSNFHGDNTNLYSYSTVIAQCLDRVRDVFLVIDTGLTPTTSKHRSYLLRALRDGDLVIYTHFNNGSRYFDDVDLLGWRGTFNRKKRLQLVTHLLDSIYAQYEEMLTSKSLKAELVDKHHLDNIHKLDRIYNDCSLEKWLKHVTQKDTLLDTGKFRKMKVMVRMLVNDDSDEDIANAMFGKNTWKKLQERIKPLKKGAESRARIERLKDHLGYRTKNDNYWSGKPECPYSSKELRKMTAREVLNIRFYNIMRKESYDYNCEKYIKNGFTNAKDAAHSRAKKFLGITGYGYSVDKVVKPDGTIVFNKEAHEPWDDTIRDFIWNHPQSWDNSLVSFSDFEDYQRFCASKDKHLYRERFWQMCALKYRRIMGMYLFEKKVAYDNHNIPLEFTEEENHIYNEYVVRYNRRQEMEEKRRKIEEAQRAKEREEKLQKISAYRENGLEGVRLLWIEHLDSVPRDILESPEVCYGGNVLFRFATQDGYVETSKGIRIPFADCHDYWKVIKAWHDGDVFTPSVRMAGYTVESFKDDILKAGCHRIAFCEIERMYQEVCKRSAA